jgi:hypothetical protein
MERDLAAEHDALLAAYRDEKDDAKAMEILRKLYAVQDEARQQHNAVVKGWIDALLKPELKN